MPSGNQLIIGSAVEVFNLKNGSILSGYPNPTERLVKGRHDDLEVDALLLKNDEFAALLLAVDVLGLSRSDVQIVKTRISEKLGIPSEHIFITCTHTHSSGSTAWLDKDCPLDEAFIHQLRETLVRVGVKTQDNLVPVNAKISSGEVDLAHNRRVPDGNGIANVWNDPKHKHTGQVDKSVGIVTFSDEKDQVRAMLINYSCHPVALGPLNHFASADFPGYARNQLRQSLGDIPILYTTGAAGDINPYDGLKSEPSEAATMGISLAKTIEDAIPGAKVIHNPELNCYHKEQAIERKKDGKEITTEFQLLTIGKNLAMISLPGEPLVEIGLKLKLLSDYPNTFILGYTNDYLSYLVTKKAAEMGGYEASLSFNDNIEDYIINLGLQWLSYNEQMDTSHPIH